MANSLYNRLKSNHMFSNLDIYSFNIVEKYLFFKSLDENEYLFYEGESGDFVAFVLFGELQVLKNTTYDDSLILSTIKAGDSIGEMAIIDDLSRSASVKATKKSALVILYKKDFDRIVLNYPHIGVEILKGLAALLSLHLRRTSALTVSMTAKQKSHHATNPAHTSNHQSSNQ